jgi:hypothetical protein
MHKKRLQMLSNTNSILLNQRQVCLKTMYNFSVLFFLLHIRGIKHYACTLYCSYANVYDNGV